LKCAWVTESEKLHHLSPPHGFVAKLGRLITELNRLVRLAIANGDFR
jgi:hypothetical protein